MIYATTIAALAVLDAKRAEAEARSLASGRDYANKQAALDAARREFDLRYQVATLLSKPKGATCEYCGSSHVHPLCCPNCGAPVEGQ